MYLAQPDIQDPAFVLVKPQLAENVGTTLRALWNCEMHDLRLVNPRDSWPSEKGLKSAAGAVTQQGCVRTFRSLENALEGVDTVLALTARQRDITKLRYAVKDLSDFFSKHVGKKIGFLFGPERTGLSADDISIAQGLVHIDLNPCYNSLNVAQAVLLVVHTYYEWRKQYISSCLTSKDNFQEEQRLVSCASAQERLMLANHMERVLEMSGFYHPVAMQSKMARNMRSMLTRLAFTSQEVRSLHGVLRHFENIYLNKKKASDCPR